jgi:hypothetical protein
VTELSIEERVEPWRRDPRFEFRPRQWVAGFAIGWDEGCIEVGFLCFYLYWLRKGHTYAEYRVPEREGRAS